MMNVTEQGARLFSIFDTADMDTLRKQVEHDLELWGFENFPRGEATKRILQSAALPESLSEEMAAVREKISDAVASNNVHVLERLAAERGDGLTAEDIRWYWSLPLIARNAMRLFDGELRPRMWFDLHARHLSIQDLEQDLRRRLPVFDFVVVANGPDSPLPPELRRRFMLFIKRIKNVPEELNAWGEQLLQSSSMNALVREYVRSGKI